MSIRQLPSDVVDKIKSSVAVTSLKAVVCGLLANALDAGASKVNISVDYSRGNCTVEDNGSGISPDEFSHTGGIGKLHHTSRFPARATVHGKHGDFLASLATLSLLSITSRHQSHLSHNSISIHNSNVLARNLPAPPEHRLVNFDHGTRVIVRDLFGSMPVRVKQRAAVTERATLDKEWLQLIREVVALLLAWPTGVTVSLKNTVTQREVRFRPAEKPDVASRTSRLLIQAALADSSDADLWVPVSASAGSITVRGCICVSPVATRRSQFISLGIHPVVNEFGTDVLYEEINRVFRNSSFGIVDGDEDQAQESPKLEGFTGKELRSRKGIEKWPMFYFKIAATGYTDVDAVSKLDSQGQTLTGILDLLKATCYGFLKKHHYRPRRVHLSPNESVFSTSKTLSRSRKPSKGYPTSSTSSSRASSVPRMLGPEVTQMRGESPFDGWHRVKMGKASPMNGPTKIPETQRQEPKVTTLTPLVGEGGKLLRKPFEEPSPEPEDVSRSSSTSGIIVDFESGLPLDNLETSVQQSTRFDGRSKPQPSKWLQNVIQSYENPVFETAHSLIPRIGDTDDPSHHCGKGGNGGVNFDAASMSLASRVSRNALANATLISQVDRKFILVKLPLEDVAPGDLPVKKCSSALVMLDQHAVDERCRLEDLMAGYFIHDTPSGDTTPDVEVLERPLVFEVSSKEHDLLDQHQTHFAAWGIVCKLAPVPKPTSQSRKVVVTGLPPSILERCRQEPRLLIELLRKEVWRIVDEGVPPRLRSLSSQTHAPWISRFHGCPKGILEMLHSRACRSAIMFNDPLDNDECAQLLSRLSRCAFPFQCAHGRPSMAPLVDLGAGGGFGRWRENGSRGDGVKWVKWMAKSAISEREK
ncbi:DNA mismatch repair protein [Neonectria punicea]|uniref:DNA mismatch repair protein n=1 Tax=Neonectria punicea TaxID=979145 RepID=A0ABR1GXS9_9HYPO